jgi:prophage tail gpP-like protein
MSDARGVLSLHFADQTKIDAFETVSWKESFTDPVGSLEIRVRPPRARVPFYRDRLRKGEAVIVKINNVPQATMIIQSVAISIDTQSGVCFDVRAASKLAALYQGMVNPDYSFRSQTDAPISKVVLDIAGPFGFTKIRTDSLANRNAITGKALGGQEPLPDVAKLKIADAHAHPNEKAYAMIARLCTRLGVCLRSTWDGELLLCAPSYDQGPRYSLVEDVDGSHTGPVDRFIGTISVEDSNDDQFSEYNVVGSRPDRPGATSSARPGAFVNRYPRVR